MLLNDNDKALLLRGLKRGLRTGGSLFISALAIGLLDLLPQLDLATSPWGGLLVLSLSALLSGLDKMARDSKFW